MRFDFIAARQEGYSDDEIADFLAKENGFDIGAARAEGYKTSEILEFLAEPPLRRLPAAEEPVASGDPQFPDPYGAEPAKRASSVLEGVVMPEPKFDPAEGERLSRRAANEPQQPRRQLPGTDMRQGREVEPRSAARAVTDTVLGLGQGAVSMVKGVADNIDAGDNAVSRTLEQAVQGLEYFKSDELRDQAVKRDALIYTVQKNQGELAAARAALNSIALFPAATGDVAARGAGSLIPTVGMGVAGLGPASMWATNALANAGDAASQTADALRRLPPSEWQNDERYLSLLQDGQTHEQAVATLAPIYALPAQALGGLTGFLSGRTGLERVIAGRGVGAGMRARVGTAGAEALGEQAETLVPQAAGNLIVGSVDQKTELTDSLGRAAVDTAIGSAPGAAIAASAPVRTAQPVTAPIAAIAPAKTTDEAIIAAAQALDSQPVAEQAVANIERILGEPNVSTPPAVPGGDTAAAGGGMDLAATGVDAGVGNDGGPVPAVDTRGPAAELPAADLPQPAGPDLDALRGDNAALRAQALQSLEAQQVAAAPADAVPAARDDEPAAQLPPAGPAPVEAGRVAPAATPAVQVTRRNNGTVVLKGDTQQILAALATQGLTGIPGNAGVIVAKSQAQQAATLFQQPEAAPNPAEQRAEFQAAEAKRQARAARLRAGAFDKNPLMAFLGKHGIGLQLASEFAPGQAERRKAIVPGYGPVFRRNGMNLDLLAERAAEEGFLPPGSRDDRALYDLISRAMRGERVTPQYAQGVVEQEMETANRARFEDYLQVDPLLPDDIEDAIQDVTSDPALEAELRALLAAAADEGIDTEAVLEKAAQIAENGNQDEYTRQAIADVSAARASRGDAAARARAEQGRPAAQRAGREAGQPDPGQEGDQQVLTAPTRADVEAQQERAETAPARDQREQVRRESEAGAGLFELTQEDGRRDTTGNLFDQPEETPAPATEKPVSQMSAADLLRAAADKMEGRAQKPAAKPKAEPATKPPKEDPQEPMFSAADTGTKPSFTAKELAREVGLLRVAERHGIRVDLAWTAKELPQAVKDAADAAGVSLDKIRGVIMGKPPVIYIVGSAHPDLRSVQETVFHELYGHYGIRKLFGKEMYAKLSDLYMRIGPDRFLQLAEKYGLNAQTYGGIARRQAANNPGRTENAGGTMAMRQGILMEELLAHIAQRETGTIQQKARELIGMLRQWLRDNGFAKLAEYGETDLAYLLKRGRDSIVFDQESNAAFMLTEQGVAMYARGAPVWRSALRDGVASIPAKAQGADGWRAQIQGLVNKGRVKADEVEWSGVNDWLKLQTGKVSKDQVLEYLDGNGVQVEEITLGGAGNSFKTMSRAEMDAAYERIVGYSPIEDNPDITDDELREMLEGFAAESGESDGITETGAPMPKYAQYTLPGGQNYREVLLTLPEAGERVALEYEEVKKSHAQAVAEWRKALDTHGKIGHPAVLEAQEKMKSEAKRLDDTRQKIDALPFPYKSSHWDQPNVLAHIRVNDRTDADGKRVLFVEEIQSDWGQQGKKDGFAEPLPPDVKLVAKPWDGAQSWNYEVSTAEGVFVTNVTPSDAGLSFNQIGDMNADLAIRVARQRLRANESTAQSRAVPRAPFVTKTEGWLNLALKRVITMAAQEGYDRVAFVNGEQSADRYDLSKQIKEIRYEKTNAGGYEIMAYANGSGNSTVLHEGQNDDGIPLSRVEELVGKEVAQKIANGEGKKDSSSGYRDWRSLTGLDLKVGGEGMRTFYDKIVPNAAKALLKKLGGGELTTAQINTQGSAESGTGLKVRYRYEGPDYTSAEIVHSSMRAKIDNARLEDQARDVANALRGGMSFAQAMEANGSIALAEKIGGRMVEREQVLSDQIAFDITPAMREKAAQGLPMFARSGLDAAAFRRAFGAPERMGVDRVQQIVDELTASWENGPAFEIVATAADMPGGRHPGDARGLIQNGTAYIVAANNPTRDAIARTLGHEAIGHYGLWKMLGEDGTRQFRANVQLAIRAGNKPITAIRDKVRELYVDDRGRFNLTPEQEADEIAAFAVEDGIDPVTGEFRPGFGFLKSVWAKIAAFLRDALGLPVRFTNVELQGLLVQSMRGLQVGQRLDGGADMLVAAARGERDETKTPEFRRWFGDSKVVDDQGKPLVVYHGTIVREDTETVKGMGDIQAFDRLFTTKFRAPSLDTVGSWFSTNPGDGGAQMYSGAGQGSAIYPVYLSIKNPQVTTFQLMTRRARLLQNGTDDGRRLGQAEVDAYRKWLKDMGKDGIKIEGSGNDDSTEFDNQVAWIALEPEQIKSAIGNNGNFDPANPDIRYARGTTAGPMPATRQTNPLQRGLGYTSVDAGGRAQFSPGAWLNDKIGDLAGPMLAKLGLKAASPELRRMLRQMKLEVEQAKETAAAVAGEATKLSDAERAMVSDLVEKELKAGTIPPAHAVRLAAVINDAMGKQTDELIRLGMLTRETAEKWRGQYLPRYYESKLGKSIKDVWADSIGKMFRTPGAMKGIRGKHLKGRGLYQTIPESQLADFEALGWEVRDPDYQAGLTGDGTVQVWRDFTRQERDAMGEIRDAGFRFVMGYMQTQKDIALGRLFEALASNTEMSSRTETEKFSAQVPETKVSGTGALVYGKMAGRWVSPETLSQLSRAEEEGNEALQVYRKAMSLWKESKTVLNPVAHANNIISNVTMAHFAGVSYWRPDAYMGAIRDLVRKDPMVKEAKEAGLFLGTMSDAELMQNMPEELRVLAQKQEGTAQKVGRNVWDLMSFWLRKPMGAAYQAEDTFFRYLLYRDARRRGIEPQDAVDYAQKYIFTYDDLPKGARMIRDFGLPFFAYTYKAIPALLNTALAHPERMAAPAVVLMAANTMAYAIAAGDDEEDWATVLRRYLNDAEFREKVREKEKFERSLLPEWNKGYTALMTPKVIRMGNDEVTGLPLFLDMSRMMPGGDLFDVNPNAGGIPLPQPITPSHPLITLTVGLLANKDLFRGTDLTDSNDTSAEKAEKRADWIWKQLSPAIAVNNYHWERTMNALAQANDGEVRYVPDVLGGDSTGTGRDGLPVQPKYAAMQTFGIKLRPIDLETSEMIQLSQQQKMIRDIDAEIRRLKRLSAKGAINDRTLEKELDAAIEKKMRLREGLTVDGEERD